MADFTPSDVAGWCADPAREAPLLIDVREPWEREICAIAGSQSLPLGELVKRMDELPRERELVLVCHSGVRSAKAARLLVSQGYRAHNLVGGINAWALTVDPAMRRY